MTKEVGNHIRAVVFDFDDTLVATIEAKWSLHKLIAKEIYGKELTDEDIKPHWGKPLRTLIGLLHGEENVDQIMALEGSINRDFPKVIYEDTIAVLKALRQSGKLICLVTAHDRKNLIIDLKSAGIAKSLFDYIQTADDTIYHKPDPRVFKPLKNWLEVKSLKPKQVVYVGDALHDMNAALGAGFEFIGVTTGLVTQAEFTAHNIKPITKLSDLL